MTGHTTDYCSKNPINKGKGKGGKGKSAKGGKGKGKGKGGKGKSAKGGRGRGKGNFPANYVSEDAYYAKGDESSTEEKWDLKEEESSSSDWSYEYQFSVFETDTSQEHESLSNQDSLLVLMNTDVTAWTQNNAWSEQDFKFSIRGDQPTLAAAEGGPECDFLLNIIGIQQNAQISSQLDKKIQELEERKANGETGLWMYLDSGASRSVIQEKSPLRQHLHNVSTTNGSCKVGNGANLKYLQKGLITKNNEVTVVKDLKYDLYAAVAAAKRGISCVLDYSTNGQNRSYLLCKKMGTVTPLMERKQGILEVPIHLYINENESGLKITENGLQRKSETAQLSAADIAKFWFGMDQLLFDPKTRMNNLDDISLFMFDMINSLGQKQKDFLIHARLSHLPRKAILQLIKNGTKGLPFKGKFMELCRPCLEARQRAENHGKPTIRHPNGKIGQHLHSDLAVVNLPDFNGFKYVLTVVDEISDEVVIALLKTKEAKTVLAACKKIQKTISARTKSQLKTWQFDRGSEFLNDLFEEWITRELGAIQMFSNVEHPWENGRAERSFATIFQKARAMMKYADLPNGIWGKAVMHSTYLQNRCPSSRLNYLSPLQFRTGEAQDLTRLRVFGCPAQIFVRPKERQHNKFSSRSEQGTFIEMSKAGNGFIFRIKRTNTTVEVDSADVKFNETFSDCMDRKGRTIKGGRTLQPDLINELENAADAKKLMETWKAKQNENNKAGEAERNDDNDDENKEAEEAESNEDNDDENNEAEEAESNEDNDDESNEAEEAESNEDNDDEVDNNDEETDNESNQDEREREKLKKPFKAQKKISRQNGPMKAQTIKTREINGSRKSKSSQNF
jgi:hypothetical protein